MQLHPLHLVRDLPIVLKLALMISGALALLIALSWFALDRIVAVGALQDGVAEQAAAERQIQRGLLAATELRVISRELQSAQTASAIRAALERMTRQHDIAQETLTLAQAGIAEASDRDLLNQAIGKLTTTAGAVKSQAGLRSEMLTTRQRRLFQAKPMFEAGINTLTEEIGRGTALGGGVDSVRENNTQIATGDPRNSDLETLNAYRLAMTRVQGAAIMFMATGNGSAANELTDAMTSADTSMAKLLDGGLSPTIKDSARMIAAIGTGMSGAAVELIAQSRRLEEIGQTEVEVISKGMQEAVQAIAGSFTERVATAAETASKARAAALSDMTLLIGITALVMIGSGGAIAHAISGPLRRLTRSVQAIAAGETSEPAGYAGRTDEVGRMAAAVETLRAVMRTTFLQSQMIEQIPVGVMTAEASAASVITYANPEARRLLGLIQPHLPVAAERITGQPISVFGPQAAHWPEHLGNPANLPYREQIQFGDEILELNATAILDRSGHYAGPMLIWHRLTGQVRLAGQFERSVGGIAETFGQSASDMEASAHAMSRSAASTSLRIGAVTEASAEASNHVAAAAAGAEELAVSVAEIGRQVAESARIAQQAVQEAKATDESVGSLRTAASRIGTVVKLIGDIAARTNLLALNATIEAARAGEAGRGFAVVAGEVKNLAAQTARATDEIATQITAMGQATGNAVDALRSIGATIVHMNDISTAIAEAVEQQGAATQEIARAVQQAAAGASTVNGNLDAVAEAVRDTGERAGAVLGAATLLSEQSTALKHEVRSFLNSMRDAA